MQNKIKIMTVSIVIGLMFSPFSYAGRCNFDAPLPNVDVCKGLTDGKVNNPYEMAPNGCDLALEMPGLPVYDAKNPLADLDLSMCSLLPKVIDGKEVFQKIKSAIGF